MAQKWIKLGPGFPPDPEKLWQKIDGVKMSEQEWWEIATKQRPTPTYEGNRDPNSIM